MYNTLFPTKIVSFSWLESLPKSVGRPWKSLHFCEGDVQYAQSACFSECGCCLSIFSNCTSHNKPRTCANICTTSGVLWRGLQNVVCPPLIYITHIPPRRSVSVPWCYLRWDSGRQVKHPQRCKFKFDFQHNLDFDFCRTHYQVVFYFAILYMCLWESTQPLFRSMFFYRSSQDVAASAVSCKCKHCMNLQLEFTFCILAVALIQA